MSHLKKSIKQTPNIHGNESYVPENLLWCDNKSIRFIDFPASTSRTFHIDKPKDDDNNILCVILSESL